jgi:rare lipoprotein A (peptidoglycan hydrolase)
MRKGSTSLGSLGLVPVGIVMLILPLISSVGGLLAPRAGWAAQEAASTPEQRDNAQRDALERRREWLEYTRPLIRQRRRPDRSAGRTLKVINTRATWYGPGFHGHRTASGETFNRNALTLASRHLPFGTRVRVVNPRTGRSAVARVNDRGPFRSGYTADLSQGLARRIGMLSSGPVRLEILAK